MIESSLSCLKMCARARVCVIDTDRVQLEVISERLLITFMFSGHNLRYWVNQKLPHISFAIFNVKTFFLKKKEILGGPIVNQSFITVPMFPAKTP